MAPSDTELIWRYVEEHREDAFAELVRRHIDLVYRAAFRKVGDPHVAEDVTQAVFTALAWKAPALVRHQTIVGWLHTATGFAAKELLRAERRRRRHEQEAAIMHEILSDSPEFAEWECLRPVIDDALADLDERDREVVLLRFFSALSFADVGTVLNISENTARMRVARALDKLHGLLNRRGLTSASASLAAVLVNQGVAAGATTMMAANVTGAALASATAGTSAGATATIFMSFTKVQTSIAVAAALALGAAFYESRVAAGLETQRANIQSETTATRERLAALERDLSAAERERSALQAKVVASREKNPSAAAAATVAPPPPSQMEIIRDRYLQRRAVARSDPQYQRLQTELRKRQIAQSYGPLFLRLNLSVDRIDRFAATMAEHDLLVDDIEAVAETRHVAPWDPATEAMKAAADETLAGRLHEVLTPADYAEYERSRMSESLRFGITNTVAVALYATDTPLDAAQADAITEILDRHTRVERDGTKNSSGLDWDAALADAKRVLAPPQWNALQGMRAQHRWSEVLSNALSPMVGTLPPANSAASKP